MDELVADSWDSEAERDEGTRYPETVKRRAYQLWAFKYGGDANKVSAALKAGDNENPSIEVDPHRIRDWARRYQWPIRRYKDWQSIAPDLMRTLGIDLAFGLLETAAEMRRIVTSNRMREITTISPNGAERIEEVPEIEAKDRIAAGKWIGDNYARLRELGIDAGPPMLEPSTEPIDTSPEAAVERIRRRREAWNQEG